MSVTWFICFLNLLYVKYNCAKSHHCRICVAYFKSRRDFLTPICEQPRKIPCWIGLVAPLHPVSGISYCYLSVWKFWQISSKIWKFQANTLSYHEMIIRIGMICSKIPCYMCCSACRRHIVKIAKIFWIHIKYFWITMTRVTNFTILIFLWKQVFTNFSLRAFLDQENKTKLKPTFF